MENTTQLRKNPSRETCESIIKRILMTEVLENGKNKHFRFASDFMNYFESLYPASDALTKQVQRAIKSLDMPKDEDGYYIVNKTASQLENEKQITQLLKTADFSVHPMEQVDTIFLSINSYAKRLATIVKRIALRGVPCFTDICLKKAGRLPSSAIAYMRREVDI